MVKILCTDKQHKDVVELSTAHGFTCPYPSPNPAIPLIAVNHKQTTEQLQLLWNLT